MRYKNLTCTSNRIPTSERKELPGLKIIVRGLYRAREYCLEQELNTIARDWLTKVITQAEGQDESSAFYTPSSTNC